jgi:hypothetical protein
MCDCRSDLSDNMLTEVNKDTFPYNPRLEQLFEFPFIICFIFEVSWWKHTGRSSFNTPLLPWSD